MENKNSKCYSCGDELTDANKSVEHIIPNALGGRLKSSSILCKKCNNLFGESIDSLLVRAIPLANLMDVSRDRGKGAKLRGRDRLGVRYNLIDKKTAKQAPRAPREIIDEHGVKGIEFLEDQKDQFFKSHLRKNPEMTREQFEAQTTIRGEDKRNTVFFEGHLNVISGIDIYRAVVKIAVNFYVLRRHEYDAITYAIDFVVGNSDANGVVQYYYPDRDIASLEDNEISHIIHIEGDSSERLLVAYIELFNTHNFIVILNDLYCGGDFKETYCFDLEAQEVCTKEIRLGFTRTDLRLLPRDKPGPPDLERLYHQRLLRLSDISGFEIESANVRDLS